MKRFVQYQFPVIIWILFIFWLSSIPSIPVPRIFTLQDKVAHSVVFFFLCWFAHRALFHQEYSSRLHTHALWLGFGLTVLYGVVDEVHQLFVPGRSFDYFDMTADAIGGLIYVGLFLLLSAHWRRRKRVAMLPDGQG